MTEYRHYDPPLRPPPNYFAGTAVLIVGVLAIAAAVYVVGFTGTPPPGQAGQISEAAPVGSSGQNAAAAPARRRPAWKDLRSGGIFGCMLIDLPPRLWGWRKYAAILPVFLVLALISTIGFSFVVEVLSQNVFLRYALPLAGAPGFHLVLWGWPAAWYHWVAMAGMAFYFLKSSLSAASPPSPAHPKRPA
jgi:hypothetical protein